jgi:hypothetical protein
LVAQFLGHRNRQFRRPDLVIVTLPSTFVTRAPSS